MRPRTLAHINLDALRHNVQCIQAMAPQSQLMAVVKANAYGHGIAGITTALQGADCCAVATLEEARALRQNGWQGRLLLLQGVADKQEAKAAIELDAEVVLHQQDQIDLLTEYALKPSQPVWIKLETGMHRLGFELDQLPALCQQLPTNQIHLMSHFASAEESNNASVLKQIELFENASSGLAYQRSMANSAAIINYPQSHADWVRSGLMVYGVSPLAEGCGKDLGLQPVMTFSARMLAVRTCHSGDHVGYGSSYTCSEEMQVGTVAVGYGDGYPWQASSRPSSQTNVLIADVLCPIIGRVSMDMLAVDLRPLEKLNIQAQAGDDVILWGQGLPVEDIARSIGSIPYELLCGLSGRVCYQYK